MNQRKKPCAGCPFSRKCEKGALGGSPIETYLGQIHGPFWLPCHEDPEYAGKESGVNEVQQCAGAATLRANLGISGIMPPALLSLEPDKEAVFSSLGELVAHHTDLSESEVSAVTQDDNVVACILRELGDDRVKLQAKES